MRREDLERYLERGERLGFQTGPDDDAYVGWILVSKRQYDERLLSLFPDRHDFKAEQEYARVCPYQVWVAELRRDVYERGECEGAEVYRLSRSFYFPTLEHVEEFVRAYGHTLEGIKWAREIEST